MDRNGRNLHHSFVTEIADTCFACPGGRWLDGRERPESWDHEFLKAGFHSRVSTGISKIGGLLLMK